MKSKFFMFSLMLVVIFSNFSLSAQNEADSLWEDVCFFGDSTTHGLIRYIVNADQTPGTHTVSLNRDQILTPPDGTFYLRNLFTTRILYDGKIMSIEEAIHSASPHILIVTVGVNGLSHWEKELFTQLYNQMLDKFHEASPDTEIVLQSIFPTAKIRAKHLENFTVKRVDEVNSWIEEIAAVRGMIYINSAKALKGEDGWLSPAYHNGDGLHLNTTGFKQVLLTIQAVLQTKKGNEILNEN